MVVLSKILKHFKSIKYIQSYDEMNQAMKSLQIVTQQKTVQTTSRYIK